MSARALSDNLKGSLFMVGAMATFAVEDALFKTVTGSYAPGPATMLFGLTGLVLFALASCWAREPVLRREMLRPRLLTRTGFEIGGRLFFALSLAYVPLSITSAVLQATPLVVVAGAALLFGERVRAGRWLAIGLGFLGVLLVIRPSPAGFDATSLFAVLGMIGFAGRDLATRASPPSVSGRQLGTLGFLGVTIAGAMITLWEPSVLRLPSAGEAGRLALTGLVGVFAYQALTLAMRTGDVSVVTPFRYTRLLFSLCFAVVLFGETVDGLSLAGMALIVGTGLTALLPVARRRRQA